MYPMPSYYLNKIDGAGYIEKYNFSFLPGSGPYTYDKENSKKEFFNNPFNKLKEIQFK